MALREVSGSDIVYDPVRLHPNGTLFDRIDLEDILDSDNNNRPGYNQETGWPFHTHDIQPQPEIRMQMRQRVAVGEETFVRQNMLLASSVIQDYPSEIFDESHMTDYLNSLCHWIENCIILPRDLKILWKILNLLRLNCQYSDANRRLFRSVKGFVKLIHTRFLRFCRPELQREHRDTVNICREILKLAEITDFSEEDAFSITANLSSAERLSDVMRNVLTAGSTIYFVGQYKKDVRRIVRIMEVMSKNPQLHYYPQLHDYYYPLLYYFPRLHFSYPQDIFFYNILSDPPTPSVDLIRCADIAYTYCSEAFDPFRAGPALCKALKALIDRFLDNNSNRHGVIVDEEYSDRSAALGKVLKILCQLCAKYGDEVVNCLVLPGYFNPIKCSNLILNYALLHPEEGEGSFSGKHLLYAMIMNKYIFESTAAQGVGGVGVSIEDINVVFNFAMSSLPGRYLFNGRPRLKELTDQVVDTMLNFPPCQSVLQRWNERYSSLF